jgi:hypothetical protein
MNGLACPADNPKPLVIPQGIAPSVPSCSFYQSLEPGPNGTAVCKVTPWSIIVLPAKIIELILPELGPAVPGAEFLELGISVAVWVGVIWFAHSKITGK